MYQDYAASGLSGERIIKNQWEEAMMDNRIYQYSFHGGGRS